MDRVSTWRVFATFTSLPRKPKKVTNIAAPRRELWTCFLPRDVHHWGFFGILALESAHASGANIGSEVPKLNGPHFNLYRENLGIAPPRTFFVFHRMQIKCFL